MKPATPRARKLHAALSALAERGINGERDNAREKLDRLRKRYDFDAPDPDGPDIFAGTWKPAPGFTTAIAEVRDMDVAPFIKWAIEGRTGIPCRLAGPKLLAEAAPGTARSLEKIAITVAAAFVSLWQTVRDGGAFAGDRPAFMRGLFDGMMGDQREQGQALPPRGKPPKVKGTKKTQAIIATHPYTLALGLGRQIRFSVPLAAVERELTNAIRGELPDTDSRTTS